MNLLSIQSLFNNSDLKKVEEQLKYVTNSDFAPLQRAAQQLLQAGGKRIRPIFVILGGKFGNYNIDTVKHVAVSLELIHMASLVHDDVIDEALVRRGKPTINATKDDTFAMYVGDYLFARSLTSLSQIDNPLAHQILSQTIVEVCEGEIKQIHDKFKFDQHLRNYLRRIKRKTAVLIAASCQLGAISTNASKEIHELLFRFGYYVGMAFQITDDILDFVGTEKQLGKPSGGDLKQGNITLPTLYAMRNPELYEKIITISETSTDKEMSHVLALIKNSSAIKESYKLSDQYLNKAFETLKKLPKNDAHEALYQIAKYIGKRSF